ncbi:MAG: thioredoxin family protein, partial [Candidatus Eisenbacteria bacterium]|nr:thioredoxin family protein [Candidatus Eisenbacteria bacterium]
QGGRMRRLGQALIVLLAASAHGADLQWLPFDEAYSQAISEGKPLLVDFYTDWCHWCKVMDAKTFGDPEVAKTLAGDFVLCRIHAEDGKASLRYRDATYSNVQFTQAMGVRGFPSVAFFDKEGNAVTVVPGYIEAQTFIYMLSYVRDGCYARQMSFQEFMRRKGECDEEGAKD